MDPDLVSPSNPALIILRRLYDITKPLDPDNGRWWRLAGQILGPAPAVGGGSASDRYRCRRPLRQRAGGASVGRIHPPLRVPQSPAPSPQTGRWMSSPWGLVSNPHRRARAGISMGGPRLPRGCSRVPGPAAPGLVFSFMATSCSHGRDRQLFALLQRGTAGTTTRPQRGSFSLVSSLAAKTHGARGPGGPRPADPPVRGHRWRQGRAQSLFSP